MSVRSVRRLGPLATVLELPVGPQSAGQQPRLAENLKSVADANDRAPGLGEGVQGVHHRREAGHGAGPQVVPVGEAARQDDAVKALKPRVLVPDVCRFLPQHRAHGVMAIGVAPGAGELQNSETSWTWYL